MKKILIIQTSLQPNGNSRHIADFAFDELKNDKSHEFEVELLDLNEIENEFCTGSEISKYSKQTQDIHNNLKTFDSYILVSPIYDHAISGVAKNFLDIHLTAMKDKYLGLIENAGGNHFQGKPYEKLNESVQYYNIKLLEFCPCTTPKSFNEKGELIDELVKSEFHKQKHELLKLLHKHTLENPIEDN